VNGTLRKIRTLAKLGLPSLLRVGIYRLGIRTGLHPVFRILGLSETGPYFATTTADLRRAPAPGTLAWKEQHWAFGRPLGSSNSKVPDWHLAHRTGRAWPGADKRWDKVPTFAPHIGDIKEIWEASRFDWVVAFAQQAREGNDDALTRINAWMTDWVDHNPPYQGPNWMCGQEASLRLGHVAIAALVLEAVPAPTPALAAFILTHLRRVRPTVSYALGQDNNHATSEAMGLFVGGAWLARHGADAATRREAEVHCRDGRRLLEQSISRLIFDDGGFAQYSVVYHRLMLDTLCIAELWRQRANLPRFSERFYDRAARASIWLARLIVSETGDAPNLGSNDGAWFLPVGPGGYRDFRPSAALAATLFEAGTRFLDSSAATALLDWLQIPHLPVPLPPAKRGILPESGVICAASQDMQLFLRLPGTRFRPPQADALHLDIWHQGRPFAVDSGTYSYAVSAPDRDTSYFGSSASHNTVVFDHLDHMPRIGRFLFAEWLQRHDARIDAEQMRADLVDYRGNRLARTVLIDGDAIEVTDTLTGKFAHAALHWHLASGDWVIDGDVARWGGYALSVTCDRPVHIACAMAPVSEFYLHYDDRPVIIVSVQEPCTICSRLTFPARPA
jgi:Heparinase II/III-like protein/Heparinase II/III N-terminus